MNWTCCVLLTVLVGFSHSTASLFLKDKQQIKPQQTYLHDRKTLKVFLWKEFCPLCGRQVVASALFSSVVFLKFFTFSTTNRQFCENTHEIYSLLHSGRSICLGEYCPGPMRLHIQLFQVWLSYERGKAYTTKSKVIMGNGGVTVASLKFKVFQHDWRKQHKHTYSCFLLHCCWITLKLNQPKPNYYYP